MVERSKKVFAIGIDGGTLELVKPWAKSGKLPTFARIMDQGALGELESTIPPITGPAWTSFMTGKNPGGHGIGDWMRRVDGDYRLTPVNTTDIKSRLFWDLLGQAGKRVGIINVPITYPPRPVNGFLISGLLTPRGNQDFTYPPELAQELQQELGSYQVHLSQFYAKGRVELFLQDLWRLIEGRTKAALYLMNRVEWDFFMINYVAADAIQHGLWHCIDPTHPRHDPQEAERYGNAILECYQRIDTAIGQLVSKLDDDTILLVMSDHGAGSLYKYIYLNNWLIKEDYLRLKRDTCTRLKSLAFRLGFTPASLYRGMARLGLNKFAFRAHKKTRYSLLKMFFLSAQNIDWERTRAYSIGNIGQIFINLKGREPMGIVEPGVEYEDLRDEIIARLRQMRDPETGEKVTEQVYKREEVYSGPHLPQMADILILPKDLSYQAAGLSEFMSNAIMAPSFGYTGGHRMQGLCMLSGDCIRFNSELKEARIIDLAPTILYLMGVPIPTDMDGVVLESVLKPEFLAKHPIQIAELEETIEDAGSGFSEEEAEMVAERLRGLGYVA